MILRKDLLAFNYYKKEKFTGSFCGMRYLIRRDQRDGADIFSVWTWPGPYNFDTTLPEQKTEKTFPFTKEALDEIVDYLNMTYESSKGDRAEG